MENNKIITFSEKETIQEYTLLSYSVSIETQKFFQGADIDIGNNFILKVPAKKLVKLLNVTLENHLYSKDLIGWKRGNKSNRKVFYFKHKDQSAKKTVSLKRYDKPRGRRALTGNTSATIKGKKEIVNWAFSIRGRAFLQPLPHFKLFYGVVFLDNNFNRFGKEIQHKLRRGVVSEWFNRKWYETLLAAMLKISTSESSLLIEAEVGKNKSLIINNEPFNWISQIGYTEK